MPPAPIELALFFSAPAKLIRTLAELTPLSKDQFNTIELVLPQNVKDAINGNHPDLILKPVLNVIGGSGPYYVDNIRFL